MELVNINALRAPRRITLGAGAGIIVVERSDENAGAAFLHGDMVMLYSWKG